MTYLFAKKKSFHRFAPKELMNLPMNRLMNRSLLHSSSSSLGREKLSIICKIHQLHSKFHQINNGNFDRHRPTIRKVRTQYTSGSLYAPSSYYAFAEFALLPFAICAKQSHFTKMILAIILNASLV